MVLGFFGFLFWGVFFFKCCVCWVFQKKSSPTEQKQFLLYKHLIKFLLHNGVKIDEL